MKRIPLACSRRLPLRFFLRRLDRAHAEERLLGGRGGRGTRAHAAGEVRSRKLSRDRILPHCVRQGYFVEGHVPAEDVERLLSQRPGAAGLTAPGMPLGPPGMEGSGAQRYQVLLVLKDGTTEVFAVH